MELKNIDHKKYIATVPPLKELEKTYDLIHKHKIFKETRKESMYLDPGADTVKKIEKIADSAVAELYKTALVQCGICMEFLLDKILNDILDGLEKHWIESLKSNYRTTITGAGKPENFNNLMDLILRCFLNGDSCNFTKMPEVPRKGVSKSYYAQFRESASLSMYKNIDLRNFATLTNLSESSKYAKLSEEKKLMILKNIHSNIIKMRDDISHGKSHGVNREYAIKSIEFTVRFSVGFLETMENHSILIK